MSKSRVSLDGKGGGVAALGGEKTHPPLRDVRLTGGNVMSLILARPYCETRGVGWGGVLKAVSLEGVGGGVGG